MSNTKKLMSASDLTNEVQLRAAKTCASVIINLANHRDSVNPVCCCFRYFQPSANSLPFSCLAIQPLPRVTWNPKNHLLKSRPTARAIHHMPRAPVLWSMHQDINHETFTMDGARKRILHQVIKPGAFAAVDAGLTLGGHGGLGHVRKGGNLS